MKRIFLLGLLAVFAVSAGCAQKSAEEQAVEEAKKVAKDI